MPFTMLNKFILIALMTTLVPSASAKKLMKDWNQLQGQLHDLEFQVKTARESIKDLSFQKKAATSSQEKQRFIELIKETHAKYVKDVRELNKVRQALRYRFPEKDDFSKRKYLLERVEPLEQLSGSADLGKIMDRVKSQADRKYKSFKLPQKTSKVPRKAPKSEPKDTDEVNNIKLEL